METRANPTFGNAASLPPQMRERTIADRVVRLIDLFARLCYAINDSRRAKTLLILLFVVSLFAPVLARSERLANNTIRDVKSSDITISSIGSWVRVNGRVAPARTYQNSADIGPIKLRSAYYVPVQTDGSRDALYVLMDTPPATSGVFTVSGQIMMGTGQDQPSLYMDLGDPPNVVLANWIARIGTVLMVALAALGAIVYLVHRSDYAIAAPITGVSRAVRAPRFTWYGDLGRQYGDVTVRDMSCDFIATVHEARFVCNQPKDLWNVSIRRLRAAQLGKVITPYGLLPSARISFEDERGLIRRATLVANAQPDLDTVLRVMSVVQ